MAACGALQSASIGRLSEAIPRYNDAFRAPLATGRPVINFGRLDELRASATPYSWVMKL
jgi:hypothetical protein